MNEISQILKKLIAAKTVNPPGNEYLAADIVQKYFKDNNIAYKVHSKDKNRPNVIARIGNGSTKLLIAAHTDVVPAGEGWITDPFQGVIKKGRMYGRGAIDNKGPLAAIMVLAKELKKIEEKINGEVIILAVADEEAGNEFGITYLMENDIINPHYAIIPDISGNCKEIDIAEKGALFLNVTSYGKQAHGSRPNLGINAIDLMMEFHNNVLKSKFLNISHKILGKPTVNLGQINGGVKHNLVAGKCVSGYDIRYVPGISKDDILTELQNIANKIGNFKFEVITHHEPTEVNPDNELVKTLKTNIKKHLGVEGELIGLSGATVCKTLIKHGIFAIGFSAGDDELVHCSNESISLQELDDFKQIMKSTIMDLFTKGF